jgi:hypothetical protein
MSAMSSGVSSTGPDLRALTCQKINPPAKITATAAAMRAFLVEFKILSFPISAALSELFRNVLCLNSLEMSSLLASGSRFSACETSSSVTFGWSSFQRVRQDERGKKA